MSAIYRIVVAVLITMPSLAFAGSHQQAIAAREEAAAQGLAVRCQLAVLPKNERTAPFPLRNIHVLATVMFIRR